MLKTYNDFIGVFYESYIGDENFSGRDFVLCGYFQEEGGKYYITTSSCGYPYPQVENKIRGHCYVGGFVVEKASEEQTKVSYIGDVDMKGELSEEMKKQVDEYQGVIVSKIEPAMKNVKQWWTRLKNILWMYEFMNFMIACQ